MAPDDSTRCLRCRNATRLVIDDGSNPPYPLCRYCQQALTGNVTVIHGQPRPIIPARLRANNAGKFWRSRHAVTGR